MAEITDKQQRRYHPSATELVTCCEVNYMLLHKLLPRDVVENQQVKFQVTQGNEYLMKTLEVSKYTTVIKLEQINIGMQEYLRPAFHVRLYHDAKAAEVIKSANISRIQPKYEYPNDKMHQPDEKMQLNLFLGEWLRFCIEHGLSQKDALVVLPKQP